MKTQKLRLSRIVMNFLLLVYAVFAIFPLIWMLLISFKSDTEVFTTTFLFHPTLSNYAAVLLESNYVQYMKDSLIVAGGSVLVSVVVGIPAAYALARYNFNRKEDLAFQILSFKFAPEILVVLPLFMIYQKIGLYDTYLGLIWVYQLICMPLLIWVVRGYFEDISVEIEYAAQVDGYTWVSDLLQDADAPGQARHRGRCPAVLHLRLEQLHLPPDPGQLQGAAHHRGHHQVSGH